MNEKPIWNWILFSFSLLFVEFFKKKKKLIQWNKIEWKTQLDPSFFTISHTITKIILLDVSWCMVRFLSLRRFIFIFISLSLSWTIVIVFFLIGPFCNEYGWILFCIYYTYIFIFFLLVRRMVGFHFDKSMMAICYLIYYRCLSINTARSMVLCTQLRLRLPAVNRKMF